jgi:23S rRNA (guanosine2251-2'-O)-methyltransferase
MELSQPYVEKKAFFDKVLTIYGRNTVLEALQDTQLEIYKLHLSNSNRSAPVLEQILSLAKKRDVEVVYHEKGSLSRISKNAKQDQGVALDIYLETFMSVEAFCSSFECYRVIVLDSITNPQNVGMILRSAAAGNIDAVVIPTKGTAQISPLVIKASAGTFFKIPIIKAPQLLKVLETFKKESARLYTLRADAVSKYNEVSYNPKALFVLGNESSGVSKEVETLCDESISIPMQRGVESLNVAVTAALLAFMA